MSLSKALSLVGLTKLLSLTDGDPEFTIGLIDGGVVAVPALSGARVNAPDAVPGTAVVDTSTHGTFVAAMLVGSRESGVPALCPSCTLVTRPIFAPRNRDRASPEELTRALDECVSAGARVINLSVAIRRFGINQSREFERALDRADASGALVVAAAGNEAAVGSPDWMRHPAVIPVSACDIEGHPTGETNIGKSIGMRGLLAPSTGFTSVGADGLPMELGGTSAAAPWVTGAIALLSSMFPAASAHEVRRALLGARGRRRLIPPLLDAWAAFNELKTTKEPKMQPQVDLSARTHFSGPPSAPVASFAPAACEGCAAAADVSHSHAPSYVYAVGRIEARFPSLALRKEYEQAVARTPE